MDIEAIKIRNAKVEADKAWETSWTRKSFIAFITYAVASAYLAFLGVEKFYFHAFVPAGGYVLSTLSLGVLKKFWLKNIYASCSDV
ncbi:MAG: hypothetical protein L6Q57_00970 [Alphaproteobacteria bacterium]|nr:hypothetical protein [Alphaproteobacteria bacterium]